MKTRFALFVLLFCLNLMSSQIIITELYYNTPYNEMIRFDDENINKHHRGEFIEIYNSSDSDINLKNWFFSDRQSTFWLPDKTIKKGELMLIAYSSLPYYTTVFPEYFTTTLGKENQIIYQDQILLRNKIDQVVIGFSVNHDYQPPFHYSDALSWEFPQDPSGNFFPDIWQTPSAFYNVHSKQYHPNPPQDGYHATPNPLALNFTPPTVVYQDVIAGAYQNAYPLLDWSENVTLLLEAICPISIEKVYQNVNSNTITDTKSCFTYDDAGNMIYAENCINNNTNPPNTGGNEYTVDELEAIRNAIIIHPNPTKASDNYNVTITWSGPALNKINNLQVFTSTGGLVYGFAPTTGVNSTSFNIQNQLPGVFVANFILNTGQVVSKNILRW